MNAVEAFPAVIMLLTLIPFIPIDDFQIKLLVTFRDLLPPEVYKFIETTLHDLLVKKHGTLLSVSFLIGLYLASNSIDAILQGFSQSTNLHTWHSPLKQRLLSLGLLLVLPILGLIGIPVLTMSGIAIDRLTDYSILTSQVQVYALVAAKWLISTLLVLGFVSMLYAAGDPTSPKFRLITPGASDLSSACIRIQQHYRLQCAVRFHRRYSRRSIVDLFQYDSVAHWT